MSEFDLEKLSRQFEKKLEENGDDIKEYVDKRLSASENEKRPQKHDKVLAAAEHRIHGLELELDECHTELEECYSDKKKAEALAKRAIGAYDRLSQVTEKVVEKVVEKEVIPSEKQRLYNEMQQRQLLQDKMLKKVEHEQTMSKLLLNKTQHDSYITEQVHLRLLPKREELAKQDKILLALNELISVEIDKAIQCMISNSFELYKKNDKSFERIFLKLLNVIRIKPALGFIRIRDNKNFMKDDINVHLEILQHSYDALSLENYNKLTSSTNKSVLETFLNNKNTAETLETALLEANFPVPIIIGDEQYPLKSWLDIWNLDEEGEAWFYTLPPYSMFEEGQRFIKCQIDFIEKMIILDRGLKSELLGLGIKSRKKKTNRRIRRQRIQQTKRKKQKTNRKRKLKSKRREK